MKESPFLLDVNVLLALAWPQHQFHGSAKSWFLKNAEQGWATCAVTQLGFVRLSSNPAYTSAAVSPREATQLLNKICQQAKHLFFDSPALLDITGFEKLFGHKQITDAYLVALAESKGARFVTYDARLAGLTQPGALHLLEP